MSPSGFWPSVAGTCREPIAQTRGEANSAPPRAMKEGDTVDTKKFIYVQKAAGDTWHLARRDERGRTLCGRKGPFLRTAGRPDPTDGACKSCEKMAAARG